MSKNVTYICNVILFSQQGGTGVSLVFKTQSEKKDWVEGSMWGRPKRLNGEGDGHNKHPVYTWSYCNNSWQGDSGGKANRSQTWWSEFIPWDSHGGT